MQFRSFALALAAVVAVTFSPTVSATETHAMRALATNATATNATATANSTATTAPSANSTAKAATPAPTPKKSGVNTVAIASGATFVVATLATFTSV